MAKLPPGAGYLEAKVAAALTREWAARAGVEIGWRPRSNVALYGEAFGTLTPTLGPSMGAGIGLRVTW